MTGRHPREPYLFLGGVLDIKKKRKKGRVLERRVGVLLKGLQTDLEDCLGKESRKSFRMPEMLKKAGEAADL